MASGEYKSSNPRKRPKLHKAFLRPETWDELDYTARASIRELVELHFSKTASKRAERLLANWNFESPRFVRMTPKVQG